MNPTVLANLSRVARILDDLALDGVVFVGGAAVGLLLTDPGAPESRLTKDVDVVTPVASRTAYHALEERLRAAGYSQPIGESVPICRWLMDGVLVDLMPPDETILGFSNRWYYSTIEHAVPMQLPDGTTIRLASSPFLIASKLEAFYGRGEADYRYSHDIEDIIIVLDGRMELVEEIRQAPSDVRSYLAAEFGKLLSDEDFVEGIGDHLLPDRASQQRTNIIRQRMRWISESDR